MNPKTKKILTISIVAIVAILLITIIVLAIIGNNLSNNGGNCHDGPTCPIEIAYFNFSSLIL